MQHVETVQTYIVQGLHRLADEQEKADDLPGKRAALKLRLLADHVEDLDGERDEDLQALDALTPIAVLATSRTATRCSCSRCGPLDDEREISLIGILRGVV